MSESLKADTYRTLAVDRDITVIPNFLDCKSAPAGLQPGVARALLSAGCESCVMHVSNFRPVKRARAVVEVFARIAAAVPSRLLLVGDGPDLGEALDTARRLGVHNRVEALGEQDQVLPLLSIADLFLLPSEQESFGLAALEAMACEVPVIASRVGGLHEVVEHGVTGFLHAPEDLEGMAQSGIRLLQDPEMHRQFAAEGRAVVTGRFCADLVVPMYEEFYEQLVRERAAER